MKNASMSTTQSETERKWTYSSRGKYPKANSGNITKNLKKRVYKCNKHSEHNENYEKMSLEEKV
jgi:hypothetical protein